VLVVFVLEVRTLVVDVVFVVVLVLLAEVPLIAIRVLFVGVVVFVPT